jgi:hypothetical protein
MPPRQGIAAFTNGGRGRRLKTEVFRGTATDDGWTDIAPPAVRLQELKGRKSGF